LAFAFGANSFKAKPQKPNRMAENLIEGDDSDTRVAGPAAVGYEGYVDPGAVADDDAGGVVSSDEG